MRQKQQKELKQGFPINREIFESLFDDLDNQLKGSDCDNTNKLTVEFSANNKVHDKL